MKLRNRFHRSPALGGLLAATLLLSGMSGARPAAQQQQQQAPPATPRFTEETGVTLVSVDVDVRDSLGKPVSNLTAKDFIVTEDNKAQRIDTFSFEEVADAAPEGGDEKVALLDDAQQKLVEERRRAATATVGVTTSEAPVPTLTNRRMMLLLFDISSMQPEDLQRAVDGGAEWAEEAMGNSDLVAVVTVGQRLNVLTDFTSNREEIQAALNALGASEGDETLLTETTTAATDQAAIAAPAETVSEMDDNTPPPAEQQASTTHPSL